MEKIFEVVRIKQEVRESEHESAFYRIQSPEDVAKVAQREIADEDREVFFLACLNTKNEVVAIHRAHIGALNYSLVSLKDIFKTAILNNSNAIICFHNHPSGSLVPSEEDIEVTKKIKKAGDLLKIELLDHLIVSTQGFLSLKEKGYL